MTLLQALLTPDEVVAGGRLRRIVLAGEALDYRLHRARRRTIGMQIDLDGLTVRAPRWVSLAEI
jgi:predicted metal-dependent hydrolase